MDTLFCLWIHICTEETTLEPVLRSKKVEGNYFIGYTEHNRVLLLPHKFHLSEVQSSVIVRQYLRLQDSSHLLPLLHSQCELAHNTTEATQIVNCHSSKTDRKCFAPKIVLVQHCCVTFTFDMFYSFLLAPEKGGGDVMLGI